MEDPKAIENFLRGDEPAETYYKGIPAYLKDTYWWAYIHPKAVRFFERQWLVNLILWGNYNRLKKTLLKELVTSFEKKNLQLACVYGDLTEQIESTLGSHGTLDVIDVCQIQLDNLREKLGPSKKISLSRQDSSSLEFSDGAFDTTILFFLLHEQPEEVRNATLKEALRVTSKGGQVIVIDYHQASHWNPLRYVMSVVFKLLEPFAQGFVNQNINDLLPKSLKASVEKKTFFGSLYQKVIIRC
mgnify:FL=1